MKKFLLLAVGICFFGMANAQEHSFFTDPSLLQKSDKGIFKMLYQRPNLWQQSGRFNSVLVDQPEIFIAEDSRYKGAKGDHLKQLADVARFAMIERLEAGGWPVADEAGPGVAYMRWAISDLYLKKKKRGLLSYTPVGMVVHTTSQAAVKDLWKKIDIVELGLKMEVIDSVNQEILAAGIARRGTRKTNGKEAELVTWEELDALFKTVGERGRCALDNYTVPEGQELENCIAIVVEPVVVKDE
jgi:hypothetical protein